MNVRLSYETKSLRNILKHKEVNTRNCQKKGCVLDDKLCFRKNVIYQITCNNCDQAYIGSTIRELHQRVYEHFNNSNSSVKKHILSCPSSPNNMTVKILDREKRKGNLRIREAYHINKLKPEINSKEENCIDLVLFV